MSIRRRAGTNWPPVFATLFDVDGTPLNLTGAVIVLRMRGGGRLREVPTTVHSVLGGQVSFIVPTDVVGTFHAHFGGTQGSRVYSTPEGQHFPIYVDPV